MNQPTIVLCVGMHRSGTSLTASLLQSLGVALPGELISADAANRSGYFENRLIQNESSKLIEPAFLLINPTLNIVIIK